jgi:superoxide dismutase, Fe-Mn family
MAYELAPLPYAYDALEPVIDTETMHIHHDKHHATYVANTNKLLEGHPELAAMDILELMGNLDKVPEDIRQGLKNNGGGVTNHNLYWEVMGPKGGGTPTGELAQAIENQFGSFETFKEKFSNAGITRFGSGWAWLVVDGGKLVVTSTLNQDSPYNEKKTPILVMDVWEHAYYLKYQNRRAEYVAAWWNVVNWQEVARRYQKAIAG